ncbi:MAG TPA: hydrophobic protein [Streptomyces sp.]|uniref:hydrophobic protein n=1 Tax=Streptomyces sp. TaxID=1931 RepID=UPI002BC6FFC7|nr:hydrophobic protein [Streptomyces sp.]HWU10146.1 hydrophobic protein [Streptomyces sp.]
MVRVVLVLLLVLMSFGTGFALEALWRTALIVLAVQLLGFRVRSAGHEGGPGPSYCR